MIFEKQIVKMYEGMAYTRCDSDGTAYYFSSDDFPGLKKESFPFESSMGHTLSGYVYYYDSPIGGRIAVFDHGFGGGHLSYMKEIEKLCKHGYTVFAYDHTGCMESGGKNPNGMSQSLRDLSDCISFIKSHSRFGGMDISVVGHSWGGFSTLNISALHPEISRVAVLSGFVSVEMLVNSYFGGIMKGYRKAVMNIERKANPDFVNYNAVKTLSETKARALLIYSDNDKMCHKAVHYDALCEALSGKDNVKFILEHNKGHNPNYTEDAVKYLSEYVKAKNKLSSKKKLVTPEQKADFLAAWDWNRMTAQDENVWGEIFAFLDS